MLDGDGSQLDSTAELEPLEDLVRNNSKNLSLGTKPDGLCIGGGSCVDILGFWLTGGFCGSTEVT
jgi:hypothetical protein